MKVIEQNVKLPIEKCDIEKHDERLNHGILFPDTIRGLIVGRSGCGKTNLIIQLLMHENGLRFENIYLISKSLFQDKYKSLNNTFKMIPEIGFNCYDNCEKLPDPEECEPNSVVIFDDVSATCEPNEKLRTYFSMSRHKNISCFLLCQSYARIYKNLIRDNANFIIVFPQDTLNMQHIYNDHLNCDLTFKKFQSLCTYCWKQPFGFLVIDKESDLSKGRLRSSLYHFIMID